MMTKERTQQGSLIASLTMLALGTVGLSLLSANIASAQNRPLSILNHEGDGQILADSSDRSDNYNSGTTSEDRQNNDSKVERDRKNHDDDDDSSNWFDQDQWERQARDRALQYSQPQQQQNAQRNYFRRNYERMQMDLPPKFRY